MNAGSHDRFRFAMHLLPTPVYLLYVPLIRCDLICFDLGRVARWPCKAEFETRLENLLCKQSRSACLDLWVPVRAQDCFLAVVLSPGHTSR